DLFQLPILVRAFDFLALGQVVNPNLTTRQAYCDLTTIRTKGETATVHPRINQREFPELFPLSNIPNDTLVLPFSPVLSDGKIATVGTEDGITKPVRKGIGKTVNFLMIADAPD